MIKQDGIKMGRMAAHWSEVEAQVKAGAGFDLPDDIAARMPPHKWSREDHVQEVLTARWGERYTAYRELLRRAANYEVVPDHPIHIDFDLKDSCNLACINCSENYRQWSSSVIDFERLAQDPLFKERKLMSATLGNGTEPFLVPDVVFKLVSFLRTHDIIDIWFPYQRAASDRRDHRRVDRARGELGRHFNGCLDRGNVPEDAGQGIPEDVGKCPPSSGAPSSIGESFSACPRHRDGQSGEHA